MSLHRLPRKRRRRHHNLQSPRKRHPKAKATSCLSLGRNEYGVKNPLGCPIYALGAPGDCTLGYTYCEQRSDVRSCQILMYLLLYVSSYHSGALVTSEYLTPAPTTNCCGLTCQCRRGRPLAPAREPPAAWRRGPASTGYGAPIAGSDNLGPLFPMSRSAT